MQRRRPGNMSNRELATIIVRGIWPRINIGYIKPWPRGDQSTVTPSAALRATQPPQKYVTNKGRRIRTRWSIADGGESSFCCAHTCVTPSCFSPPRRFVHLIFSFFFRLLFLSCFYAPSPQNSQTNTVVIFSWLDINNNIVTNWFNMSSARYV